MTKKYPGKAILIFSVAFLAGSVGLLWAWNTLADLFDAPLAQYKHAVAASVLAFLLIKTWHVVRRHALPRH